MTKQNYNKQASLMLKILPIIARHQDFALKGGTALNFFILNMPRLSVDIDLTFLPVLPREETLMKINNTLEEISREISNIYGYRVNKTLLKGTNYSFKVVVSDNESQIKIEPNIIIRGSVYQPSIKSLSSRVEELFAQSLEMQVLNESDIYGGKICAALDRQHPRDLFD